MQGEGGGQDPGGDVTIEKLPMNEEDELTKIAVSHDDGIDLGK